MTNHQFHPICNCKRTGEALKSLDQLEMQQKKFDFIFIDADKGNYPNYLDCSLRLANPGALLYKCNFL